MFVFHESHHAKIKASVDSGLNGLEEVANDEVSLLSDLGKDS